MVGYRNTVQFPTVCSSESFLRWWQVLSYLLMTVTGFFIAARWGKSIETVAWSWDITLTINFINTYFIMYVFTLKEKVWPFFKSLLPQCYNSLFVSIAVYFICMLLNPDTSIIVNLLFKVFSILSATFFMAIILNQYKLSTIVNTILRKRWKYLPIFLLFFYFWDLFLWL